jgi:hypothetical protein
VSHAFVLRGFEDKYQDGNWGREECYCGEEARGGDSNSTILFENGSIRGEE